MNTIPGVLFQQAISRPNAMAIHDGEAHFSYGELADFVKQLAGVMREGGLEHGQRFAIWAPNCWEWVAVALAGQALGAILVPLNTRYKGAEAADILRRADCRLLFTVDGFLGLDYPAMLDGQDLPNLSKIIVMRDQSGSRLDAFMKRTSASLDAVIAKPDDISDIIYTSGTTGAPKGAMTTHGQNVQVFESFTQAIGMTGDDRYLVVNPFFHSFGYKAGWLSCLVSGAAIHPAATFDPASTLGRIERERITVMPGAPTIFQTLLGHADLDQYDISSLRVATTGATTIPVDLIRRMSEDLGIDDVFSAYGLTESCGVVSLCQKGDDFETIATTCGRPLPGTKLRIVDEGGADVAAGEEGEIWVKGHNVMQGYLDDEAGSAEAITSDGWLKTGDIGTQDERGYIKITDRKKDMIIVGGFNCYPAEVEKALLTMDGIADIAVTGMADDRLGEVVCAHIVNDEGRALDAPAITAWAREHMANYKVPRRIIFHDALPRNASGKVLKFMLKNTER